MNGMTEYQIKKNHSINCKQQIPPTIIHSITKTITRKENLKGKPKKKMGHIYILQEGNPLHHTTFQERQCGGSLQNKEH
jgi:hypothetical protein